ncbi:MAG: hypothetical protein DRJ10_03390, partial [Bacteroidetes bacterium]
MRKLTLLFLVILLSVFLWSCSDSDKVSDDQITSVDTPKADKATIKKMLGQAQPGDGTVLTGGELIVTWPLVVNQANKVIARFREKANDKWQELVAEDGSIKVDGLETGKDYQYQLVAEVESEKLEGIVCNVTFQEGPGFVSHESAFSIPREYQIRRSIE